MIRCWLRRRRLPAGFGRSWIGIDELLMWFRIAVLSTLLISLASAADAPLLTMEKTIPLEGVEGRIDHCGLDRQRKRLYVAAIANGTLEVVDLVAGKRINNLTD